MKTVYLHGNPGSPAELALLGGDGVREWFAPDRARLPIEPTARYLRLAELVAQECGERPVRLVGFSAGAHVALQVAALMPEADCTLHLISPAGPLETGAYLERMAGGAVFSAAQTHPGLFSALVLAQSLCARWLPGVLTQALFTSARGEDKALVADKHFSREYRSILRACLAEGRESYRAEILTYVRPWADVLPQVSQPVTLWQGSCDNWTPPDMAETLARLLPNVCAFHMLSGLSHFSTLRAALAELA